MREGAVVKTQLANLSLTIFAKWKQTEAFTKKTYCEKMQFSGRKMVRSKGLEPSRLLGTTTSRLRVYQFHHERIAGRGTWLKHRPLDKPFLPSRWQLAVFCRLAKRLASPGAPTCGAPGI